MAKVYILTGRIASGKTTWAATQKKQRPAILLSCDDMLLELFDACLGEKHAETESRCLNFLFGQAAQIVETGIDAILDSGFWTAASRKKARDYFSRKGIDTVTVYFKASVEARLKRLENRNRRLADSPRREFIIDAELLKKLDEKFEEPSADEYDTIIESEA